MASSEDHLRLYGFLRKKLLSRYFALGRRQRNDFYQESTTLETGESREEILRKPDDQRALTLWRKQASRDNPWLFGSKLTVALATEARLGLPGAEPLLGRLIRSCERLVPFSGSFRGVAHRTLVPSTPWPAGLGAIANTRSGVRAGQSRRGQPGGARERGEDARVILTQPDRSSCMSLMRCPTRSR